MSNRTDENTATIAALIITLIIGVFILTVVSKCEAWTENEFRPAQYGSGDWKITSLPAEIRNSMEYKMGDKMGHFSYVLADKCDGKWDKNVMVLGRYVPQGLIDHAKLRIKAAQIALDKVLPDEKVIVISFIIDYTEMDVFFAPKRWQDQEFHNNVAEKLNIERKKWKKSANTD